MTTLELGGIPLRDELGESLLELLDVGLLAETGIASVLPVAVAILPGALIGGEVGTAGTSSLGLSRVIGGSSGGEGGGLISVTNALRAGLDPVRRREGGDMRRAGARPTCVS